MPPLGWGGDTGVSAGIGGELVRNCIEETLAQTR